MPLISFLKIDTFLQVTGMQHSRDYFEIGVYINQGVTMDGNLIHSAVIHERALAVSRIFTFTQIILSIV